MGTGFKATFVISWSQTEVDGASAVTLDMLTVGAAWRWTGSAVRIDAPGGVLLLEGAEGAADMRQRAARMVQRLIGVAVGGEVASGAEAPEIDDMPDQCFIVTDGTQSWPITILPVPDSGARLLMFHGAVPPASRAPWIVRAPIARTGGARVSSSTSPVKRMLSGRGGKRPASGERYGRARARPSTGKVPEVASKAPQPAGRQAPVSGGRRATVRTAMPPPAPRLRG